MSAQPYYQDDAVTIYHGDTLEVLPLLPAQSACITVTSPPYNMGVTPGGNGRGMYGHTTSKASRFTNSGYDGQSDALPADEYDALLSETLIEMWRVSRLAVWWNHRPRIIHGELHDPLDGRFPIGRARQRITLARPTGIDVGLGHFATRGELLYLFAKDAWALPDHATSGMGDVWSTPLPPKGEHPAPFHISVPERCIHASPGTAVVLDPFSGSGTTLLAAKQAGLMAVGIEQSERFCEIAAERCGGSVRTVAGGFDFDAADTPKENTTDG